MQLFFLLTMPGGKWDHKSVLRERFFNNVPPYYTGVRGDNQYMYYYDIWSNIHFGYVGRAIGFEREWLEDNQRRFGGRYDAGDTLSVKIGMDIWDQNNIKILPAIIQYYILQNRNGFINTDKAKLPTGVYNALY